MWAHIDHTYVTRKKRRKLKAAPFSLDVPLKGYGKNVFLKSKSTYHIAPRQTQITLQNSRHGIREDHDRQHLRGQHWAPE